MFPQLAFLCMFSPLPYPSLSLAGHRMPSPYQPNRLPKSKNKQPFSFPSCLQTLETSSPHTARMIPKFKAPTISPGKHPCMCSTKYLLPGCRLSSQCSYLAAAAVAFFFSRALLRAASRFCLISSFLLFLAARTACAFSSGVCGEQGVMY